ncbi:MAG: hypothetical protein OEZ55_14160 [Nitrospinota bacterium]|nr:hypothetical protein [Nitrospinota bacterium]
MNQVSASSTAMSQGWAVFKGNMGGLILAFIIYIVAVMILSMVPLVNFFSIVWMPPLWGGLFMIFIDAAEGETVNYGRFMDGFKDKFLSFVLVYLAGILAMIGFMIVLFLAAYIAIGGDTIRQTMGQFAQMGQQGQYTEESYDAEYGNEDGNYEEEPYQPAGPPPDLGGLYTMFLFFGFLFVVFAVLFNWFLMLSFACVAGRDMGAIEALGTSFSIMKSSANAGIVTPFMVTLIMVISVIPFGLGLLFTLPWSYCVAVIAAGAVGGAATAQGSSSPGAFGASAGSSPMAAGEPPPIQSKFQAGSCAHCFVFQDGPGMDDNLAWDYMEAAHKSILDSNPDMDVTGQSLAAWPKTNDEFKKIAVAEINRYTARIPTAPDFMDGLKFKISVKPGKNPANNRRMVCVFIICK